MSTIDFEQDQVQSVTQIDAAKTLSDKVLKLKDLEDEILNAEESINKLMIYLRRMPIEFQTITLQNTLYRNHELLSQDAIQEWILEKGDTLL